jgi:signal transduction histidine kinase/DNA-binding response OmpR family regulator
MNDVPPMRKRDWSHSRLGAPDQWPQSLKTAIRIMLTSRQPIWIGWGDDLIYFYNDAYKSIIGGKHPWALGRPTADVWREIWPEIGPMLATAMGGVEGTYVEEQLLIMERNGYPEETYYTFSYSPIPDDDGSPGGIICANTDDTKRVIGERQLALLGELATRTADTRAWRNVCEQSVAALRTNLNDLPFALFYMTDTDDQSLMLMGSTVAMDGHPAAPLTIALDDSAEWNFRRVLRTREMYVVTDLAERVGDTFPTGAWNIQPSQAALLPVFPAGNTRRAGVLIVGLNPFRLVDDSYRGFLNLIAGQIAAAVANADAYEQERCRAEALAELDRAKTAFFANISHEFRTPLTLMLGPLEEALADSERLPPDAYERVRVVHRNGMRLLKLVNSLLDFSRIEAGRTQASFEPVDLAALTTELASNFRSAAEKAGIALRVDCPPAPELFFVDRDMWEKIVLNLLSNAFKFTFDGEIAISLRHEESHAVLIVRDTGTGIPAHELPRLFERFHRIEGARGRSFEGSGIGLALVQELVNLHGGTIRVESDEGHGTAFVISIPAGSAHLPRERIRGERKSGSTAIRAQAYVEEALRWLPEGAPAEAMQGDVATLDLESSAAEPAVRSRVLVVDDNSDMRDYICRLLQPRHDCATAANGEAALEQIREQRPDLLLTDIMMPKLDGFGLIAAIRLDPALRDLPVIVLSARAGEEESVDGITAGADDYLAKPFSARELIARVDGVLATARMRRLMGEALREEAESLEILNRVGTAVASELDLGRAVQVVTDAATRLTGAAFGSFFYNVLDERDESYMLYTISGVPREEFSKFPMPRNTAVFAPTFAGEAIVRSDDILRDPRYGKNDPHHGMPAGHLPVRSYLAAPVISRSGEVLGGLFRTSRARCVHRPR